MRHQNVCFYLIYIINPFVERPLVSANGLSTKITSLSTKITHCSTKISSLSTKITSLSMKLPCNNPLIFQKSPISSGFFCRKYIYIVKKENIPHISHISHVN